MKKYDISKAAFWAWVLCVFWMETIFVLSSLPGSKLPAVPLSWMVHKSVHLVEYAVLAVLFHRAMVRTFAGLKTGLFWIVMVLVSLYAVSDEWHQSFVPGRGSSPVDVMLDIAFGFAGLSICRRFLPNLTH